MKKTIAGIGALVIIILLANWWAGKVVRDEIDITLIEILGEEQARLLSYEDISVSPFLSQIILKNFSFRNADYGEFQAEAVRTSLRYRDFLRILIGDSERVFTNMSYLSFYLHNSVWTEYNRHGEFSVDDVFITFRGNLTETLLSVFEKRNPSSVLNLDFDIYEMRRLDYILPTGFLPELNQIDKNGLIEMFQGRFRYDPVQEQIIIRKLRLRTPYINLELDGIANYNAGRRPFLPDGFSVNYILEAQTNDTRFTISPALGQFTAEDILIRSSATFEINDDLPFSLLNVLFSDANTTFNLDQIRLHPSDTIIQEYGLMARAFGLDLQSLYVNEIGGQYVFEADRLFINNTKLETAFFTATLNMDITLNEQSNDEPIINEGSLRISDMSPGIESFFENIEVLFSLSITREEEDFLIIFHGPLNSPEIID